MAQLLMKEPAPFSFFLPQYSIGVKEVCHRHVVAAKSTATVTDKHSSEPERISGMLDSLSASRPLFRCFAPW